MPQLRRAFHEKERKTREKSTASASRVTVSAAATPVLQWHSIWHWHSGYTGTGTATLKRLAPPPRGFISCGGGGVTLHSP